MHHSRNNDCILLLLTLLVASSIANDVRQPPNILEPPVSRIPDVYIREGAKVRLPCEATGTPEPTYSWLHNAHGLDISTKRIRQLKQGEIEISDLQMSDQGEYQCAASNKYGTALSQVFMVKLAILEDSGNLKIETYRGELGKSLVLPKRETFSLPESWYVWMTIGGFSDPRPTLVQHDERVVQDMEGNLHFTSLRASDALENGRFYKMDVHNAVLQSALGGSYSSVSVDASRQPMEQPPALIYPQSSPHKVDVLEGTQMRIQCIFSGHPTVQVTWSSPSVILATTEEAGTRLVLKKMSKEAVGVHICTGTNRAGTDRGHITVDMTTTPKFTVGGAPSNQTKTEGDMVTFTCQTSGDTHPQATVEWMINGELLLDQFAEDDAEVTHIANGKRLVITDLDRDRDTMVIQCKAYNRYKTVYVNAPLLVLKRTKLTERPMNETFFPNTTKVVFGCRATSDLSTNLIIKWFRDGKAISIYEDLRMKQDNTTSALTLNLDGLVEDQKASYRGEYTCTATNGYSNDSHTAVLKFTKDTNTKGVAMWIWILVGPMILGSLVLCCIWFMKGKPCPILCKDAPTKETYHEWIQHPDVTIDSDYSTSSTL